MAESVHIRSGHYWLARTVETAPGSGTCIEKITDRRTSRGSTTFTLRDYAISVEWFHRVDTDAMGLSFSKHTARTLTLTLTLTLTTDPDLNPKPDPNQVGPR
jgi:hypothetical protein|tara:strand:- start:19 stop:324 length:306 start_codon:yes stop_codon:yes gene_type:complete